MIDILLSVYNGAKYLPEQLDSLFRQTYQDFRIIIRDDCSNDNSSDIIKKYSDNYPQKIIVVPDGGKNLGASNSFFELFKHSTSDLIMFCDQDDVWNNDKLEMVMDFYYEKVETKNSPLLIHTAADVVDENLNLLEERTRQFNKSKFGMEKSFIWQIFQNDVTGCTVMINSALRELVKDIDFMNHKVIQHDWFLAQIAHLFNSKYYLPIKTIKYRQHANNVMGAKKITFIQRIILKIKYGTSYPYYDQIKTLLQINIDTDKKVLLSEFAKLQGKSKLYRVYWHIKKVFFREGGILKKAYQLWAC